MKKLCTIIMLGLSVWVYGQKSEREGYVKKEHKQKILNMFPETKSTLDNGLKGKKQFLLEDSLVAFFLQDSKGKISIKKDTFSSVYNKLWKLPKRNIIDAQKVDVQFKGAGQDSVNSKEYFCYYETKCEVHTIAKKDSVTSNAKFDVVFVWEDLIKRKDGESKKITIKEIRVTPKEYTTNELANAKAEIKGWYNKLDKNLPEKYRNDSVCPLAKIKDEDVELSWNNQNKKFTTTTCPKVKIIVPWEIAVEDSIYYEPNPVAYYELAPIFMISMVPNWTKKTLTAVIDTVIYEKGSIVPPVKKVVNEVQRLSDGDRGQREVALMTFIQRFRIEHMKFAGRQTEKGRKLLENMFTDKETGIVEVAKLIDFQERINSRIAKDYLSRLRGRLSVKLLKEQVQYNPTMDIVIFPFEQRYSSLDGKYEDETTKKLHLRYVDGNYSIERITVVPNTTHLITIK